MSSNFLFRSIGGVASIISGLFLSSSHLINLQGGTEGTVVGNHFVLFGHLGLILAFISLYEAQGSKNNLLSTLGMLFSVVGSVFVTAVVYLETAAATSINGSPTFDDVVSEMIFSVGPLFFVVGMIIVGISIMKEGILPKTGGLCLIIGTFIFAMASVITSAAASLTVIGGIITGLGFVWLGSFLLSAKGKAKITSQYESNTLANRF